MRNDIDTCNLKALDCWLFDTVLPHWLKVGLDSQTGVPVECLASNGAPMVDVPRRGRVMPRQIFTFARAVRLGFGAGDSDLILQVLGTLANGIETLRTVCFDSKQGLPSQVGADGVGQLYNATLYDHAFMALAGVEAAALDIDGGRELADTAFDFIAARFKDDHNGGYNSATSEHGAKLSNPHMHLFEASLLNLAVKDASGADVTDALALVKTLATLCLDTFISSETGFISEELAPDFSPSDGNWIEPGHCYEWAYLLHCAGDALDDAKIKISAKTLFQSSETFVEDDGFVTDRVGVEPKTYRLWPQLERLRCLATFKRTDAIPPLVISLNAAYFSKGPDAGWVDKVDASRQPLGDRVPASMLYHLMTAIPVVTRPDIKL